MSTPIKSTATANVAAFNSSPRTPQRGISSTFSSPGYRTEEDTIIFEIGTRYFRAGLANDSAPRCTLEYGPESSRRCGDYRQWLPGYENRIRHVRPFEKWTKDYELWQLDSRRFDLGLMEDKIDRAFRNAFSKYLLMDSKARKVMLVVPALMTHAVISRMLTLLFHNYQIAAVTLLTPPTMAVVAAGQRSGLVVDIGWHETIITAVYEFREIMTLRSTRAMKGVLIAAAKLLEGLISKSSAEAERTSLDFQYVEEFVSQIIWCRNSSSDSTTNNNAGEISIRLPPPLNRSIAIPWTTLSEPVEKVLFADSVPRTEQDDQEHALNHLLYEALIQLDPDVRSICMSRIVFTGGGANIPGLKARMLTDLESMVNSRGWSHVWHLSELAISKAAPKTHDSGPTQKSDPAADDPSKGAAFEEQVRDVYGDKLMASLKPNKTATHGEIRGIETMGAFAGASITAALHLKGLVEIDGALFLQHGLLGPKKDQEPGATRPKSFGGPLSKLPTSDTQSWTLGAWA